MFSYCIATFPLGESLKFGVLLGPLEVGEVSVSASSEVVYMNGKATYHVRSVTKSHPFFDIFYKVRNIDDVYIETGTLRCVKIKVEHSLPKYHKVETYVLDQEVGEFRILETSKVGKMPTNTHHTISALYYLRTLNLKPGDRFNMNIISGDKVLSSECHAKRYEEVEISGHKHKCLLIQTNIKEQMPPFAAKGDLFVWIDEKKQILKLKTKISIGSISLVKK